MKNKIGLKVKIVAKVWDQGSRESYEGFAEVLVDEPRVQLNFIGSGTQFIDAEMPFDTLVMDSFQVETECKLIYFRLRPQCRTALD